MKLNKSQLQLVEEGLGLKAIDESSTVVPQLVEAFGAHTFFPDTVGLCVIEADPTEGSDQNPVVRLAKWNEDQTALEGHQPEAFAADIDLGPVTEKPDA